MQARARLHDRYTFLKIRVILCSPSLKIHITPLYTRVEPGLKIATVLLANTPEIQPVQPKIYLGVAYLSDYQ